MDFGIYQITTMDFFTLLFILLLPFIIIGLSAYIAGDCDKNEETSTTGLQIRSRTPNSTPDRFKSRSEQNCPQSEPSPQHDRAPQIQTRPPDQISIIAPNWRTHKNTSDGFESRPERNCRYVLETYIFPGFKFAKIRPDWLPNVYPGHVGRVYMLELDMYNDELKLAVEYNGAQHYRTVPDFHLRPNDRLRSFEHQQRIMGRRLYGQQCRDRKKMQLCIERGVDLVVVRFDDERPLVRILLDDPIIQRKVNLAQAKLIAISHSVPTSILRHG